MLPAHERLDADHRAGRELDGRLVAEHELVLDARAAQVGDELEPPDDVLVHPRRVDDVLGLAARLRAVHRDVRRAQQLGRVPRDRDADACGDEDLAPLEIERRLEDGDHALGRVDRGGRPVLGLDEDRELVAAEPRDRVLRGERVPQPQPDGLEERVAAGCPKLSFTALKSSRSRKRTATSPPPGRGRRASARRGR